MQGRPFHSARGRSERAVLVVLAVLGLGGVGAFQSCGRSDVPSDPAADQLQRELVAAYFASDDRERMQAAIAPLVERSDPDPEDLASAAAIALKLGDVEKAREYLEQGKRANPDSARIQYNLARVLREWDLDFEGAVRSLERARKAAPDDLPTILMLANSLESLERVDEAEQLYREVLARGVDNAGAWYMPALYRLSRITRDRGDDARADELDAEYMRLTDRGLAAPAGDQMNVGVLGAIPMPAPRGTRPEGTGALPELAGSTLLPDELDGASDALAADLDLDGRLDLVAWGPKGVAVAQNAQSGWKARVLLDRPVERVLAFDLGNDDDLDLLHVSGVDAGILVAEADPSGGLGWSPWTKELPPFPRPVANVLAVDYDHEGDLDLLFVGEFGVRLLRDDGAAAGDAGGVFSDVTAEAGLPADRSFDWAMAEDFDTDQDVDLLLGGGGFFLASNARSGRFDDESARLAAVAPGVVAPIAADFDADGRPDLWGVVGASARIWDNGPSAVLRPREGYDHQLSQTARLALFDKGARALDLDLDGALDIVWKEDGALGGLLAVGLPEQAALASGLPATAAFADLTGDGTWELVALEADGVSVHATRSKNHGQRLAIRGRKDNRRGVGAVVELRAGPIYRRTFWTGVPELFGFGQRPEADLARLTWPNGVIQYIPQDELRAPAAEDSLGYQQSEGLVGSCPFLYTWNGTTFEFVSDVLGITPLGLPMEPGVLVPPDHDEFVLVRGEQLRERDGALELQLTEELREVTYLDRVRLDVVDHPLGTEIYPDERFCFPPFASGRTLSVHAPLAPLSAVDGTGRDWAAALAAIDGEHAAPFEPAPPQLEGIANPHVLELAFDRDAVRGATKLRLVMTGWFFWSNASVNVAIARDPRWEFVPPIMQVPDGEGGWRNAGPPVGFPAGKTKTMVIDVTDMVEREDPRLRVFSTLRLYWDSIRLAVDGDDAELSTTSLEPASAKLWRRGFSAPLEDERPNQPERFVWERLADVPRWNPHPGRYTRLGETLPLVQEIDDRFVILGAGDALHVRFDARALPPVAAGFRRDYLVFLDGWAKDRDPNTLEALFVEPLPFHGMSGYPYGDGEAFPDDELHRAWRREWNTRLAEPWLPRLAGAWRDL